MLLNELQLGTNQLSALSLFYKEVLGLPVTHPDKHSILVRAGATRIIFKATDTAEAPFYHLAFNIPSNKSDEALQWMQSRVELLWLNDYKGYVADFTNWHAKSFYFADPAGNILELISRFGLPDITSEKFSSTHIRNVSEIGLVFPLNAFDIAVDNLLKEYSLGYFGKQPPMPHFRAVGNDEGLFVIVPENRVWFSSKDTPARIFPMKINFTENGRSHEFKM